ncbi:OmpW/AlkL family protein [Acinetobacter sp. MD2(2019)]|uniref:OmpW/AlkL family protein n=1 Tax=Acinetobacter sp. MD2(2019) TaxID=2605273 RepID=UPI002D1E7C06|nr:OmpW family outer membrane protein [Acinetobacter sp. MD2(2019)]MEB3753393.1 OmpW family protein [Acinetobacter sp. MD2(2019)]
MKQITKALLPATLLALSFASHAETSDGKTVAVSAGWAHIMPQGKQQGVQSTSNIPTKLPSKFEPNAGFELEDGDTAELKLDYLVNDNASLGLVLGAPPKLDIKGKGQLLGGALNLDKFSKVGDVKVYSPVLTGKYTFGTVNSKFRPYVGAGLMYARFSNFKLDSAVSSDAATKGMSIRNVSIDDAIAPVAFVGADYNINSNWFATASVSYVHLSTHAKLDIVNNASGQTMVTGSSKIEINPIVTYLGLGYRF